MNSKGPMDPSMTSEMRWLFSSMTEFSKGMAPIMIMRNMSIQNATRESLPPRWFKNRCGFVFPLASTGRASRI